VREFQRHHRRVGSPGANKPGQSRDPRADRAAPADTGPNWM